MTKQGLALSNSALQAMDKNRFSRDDDNNAVSAMEIVKEVLETEYPNSTFKLEKKVYIKDVYNLDFDNPIIKDCFKSARCGYISPDGGVIYKDDMPIVSVEMKNQGSEATRKTRKQGNALERGAKNVKIMKDFFKSKGITTKPYIMFCHGYDFEVYKTAWRIALSFVDYQIDKVNMLNSDEINLFIQPDDFTVEQIASVIYATAKTTIAEIG